MYQAQNNTSTSPLFDQRFQFRQQDDAFLFVRVGARDHRRAGLVADIGRKMRHVCGNIEHFAGADGHEVLEPLAVPHYGFAFDNVDRGLVALVFVRLGAAARRYRQQMHADALRADGLLGKALEIVEALLAAIGVLRPNDAAGRLRL